MTKQNGLGDNLYIGGYDISGDVGSVDTISGGPAVLDVTGINKSAFERLGGLRSGEIDFTAFFDSASVAVGGYVGAHGILSTLPRTDTLVSYIRGAAIGNPSACMVAKQIGYDPTRAADGGLTFKVQSQANGYGLEWGQQLTPGIRTDTAATNGTSLDLTTVSTAFGWQAYLQVLSFTGTDVTVKLQDSADNSTFADLTTGAFAQITSTTPGWQRIAAATSTATVRRYVRASTITTGGFNPCSFAVVFVRNLFVVEAF